jgi:hypothetical protein
MSGYLIIEEFHLTLSVRRGLSDRACAAVRPVLGGRRFRTELSRAVRVVIRRHPALVHVRVTISR